MSRLREWDWKAAALGYFTPLLLSLGMSLTLLRALLPQQALWPAVLLCAGFTLVFYALFQVRLKWKWVLPVLLIAVLGAWAPWAAGRCSP
jgi:hypothetical protein